MTTNILPDRRIQDDWWNGGVPQGVVWGDGLYVESAQVFKQYRTKVPDALVLGLLLYGLLECRDC